MADLLVACGTGLAVWAVIKMISSATRHTRMTSSLRRVGLSPAVSPGSREPLLGGVAEAVSRTPIGSRLRGHASRTHPQIAFSDVLALWVAASIGASLVAGLLLGSSLPAVLLMVAAPFGMDRVLASAGGRWTARLEQQIPDALYLQSSAMRAGQSMVQGLVAIADDSRPPLRSEVRRVLDAIELGNHLDEVLPGMVQRTQSRDVELWVTAMLVHRSSGGNLAATLESLASRVRDRLQVRSEVRALTAQGRLSGAVVALAPVAFFFLLSATSPQQMAFLYSTPLGWGLLGGGVALDAAGFVWIRSILKVKP